MINRKGCELLGYKHEELIGTNWFAKCLPQPNGFEIIRPIFKKMISGDMENIEFYENDILTKDGQKITILWHNRILKDKAGINIGTLSSGENIAEKNKYARRNKVILESIPDFFFIFNKEGFFVDYHVSLRLIPALLSPPSQFIGKHITECLPPEIASQTLRYLYLTFEKKIIHEFEYPLSINNQLSFFEARMIYCDENEVLTIVRNIDERKKLLQEQEIMTTQLMHSSKLASIGALASCMAHEINNPNSFILLNIDFLDRSWKYILNICDDYYNENGSFSVNGLPYEQFKHEYPFIIKHIRDGSFKISSIVKTIKEYATHDSYELNEQVNLNENIENSFVMLKNQVIKSTRCFELSLNQNLPLFTGNNNQVCQIIINLIQNACQALTQNDQKIKISTYHDNIENFVIFEIEDQGEGISKDNLLRVTEPFFTTKKRLGGTGLGLYICELIIKKHKGHLSFQSQKGVGTKVTVKFPTGI